MPEIAEVARVVHFLRLHLVGKRIAKVLAPDDANVFGKVGTSGGAFEKALAGKRVVGAGTQGKYFWLLLDSPPHPVMHLGMTGWVHIRGEQTGYTRYVERMKDSDKEQWPPRYCKFELQTDSDPRVEVAFTDARRFGRVRLVDCAAGDIRQRSPLVENGPDPVVDRDAFSEEFLRRKMRSRRVPVKALLLDQATVSGVGNWVGDEILYQARLHPEQYCDEFGDADVAALHRAVRYVCDTAVAKLGDSDQFPEHWLFNHRWGKGKKGAVAALPSGEKITFITVGGRTSCVVPSVQKKKAPRGAAVGIKKEEEGREGEDEPTPPDVIASGTKSRFFSEPKAGDPDPEPPKKKARTSRATAKKEEEVEEEEEEGKAPQSNGIRKPRPAKPQMKEKRTRKPIAAAPDTGRRRSNRLSKAASS